MKFNHLKHKDMKGLKEYIAKYGRHLTEQLAEDTIVMRWSTLEIDKSSRDLVYYNVSSATIGDVVYLTNLHYHKKHLSKAKSIRKALDIIGDVTKNGYAFDLWVQGDSNIDLENYI